MNEVIATRNFEYSLGVGLDYPPFLNYDETCFTLCFNFHASYPGVSKEDILGVKSGALLDDYLDGWFNETFMPYYTSGVTTHFADHD